MRVFSPARLVAGLIAVALLAVPVFAFVVERGGNGGIEPAKLVTTQASGGADVQAGVAEGKLAPDFEISTPDGERVRLSELRGRPVVINFWAQWCGSCLTEMPEIKALQEERGLDTVTVLAINAGETPAEAQEFIDFLEAPFIYGLDVDLTVSDAYGVYGLPLSVFIDSEGVIQALYIGHANRQALETLTDAAIEARPAGEIPVALRLVSSIRRERILTFSTHDGPAVTFNSRSLRCDPGYCAEPTVDQFRTTPGVRALEYDRAAASLDVEFDPGVTDAATLAEQLAGLIQATPDPVYQTEVLIRAE